MNNDNNEEWWRKQTKHLCKNLREGANKVYIIEKKLKQDKLKKCRHGQNYNKAKKSETKKEIKTNRPMEKVKRIRKG